VFQHFIGKRIVQSERYEVRGAFFCPVWQAAPVVNGDLAEAGARRPRDSRRDAGATSTTRQSAI
jgi:hypothetical protein